MESNANPTVYFATFRLPQTLHLPQNENEGWVASTANPNPAMRRQNMKVFGWKKIGEYLGCDPRTAQYQEKENGLPINRLPGKPGRVYSTTEALEMWMSGDKKNTRNIVLNFNPPVMHVNISIGPPVGGMTAVFALGVPVPK